MATHQLLPIGDQGQFAVRDEQIVVHDTITGAPRHTLLYVEDNPANLRLVEEFIALFPQIELLATVNGTLGIQLARAAQPEVILMHINRPGIRGVKALKIMREDAQTAHIPVIAMGANPLPRNVTKSSGPGFFRYLTKPIMFKDLTDTLNAALNFAEKRLPRAQEAMLIP